MGGFFLLPPQKMCRLRRLAHGAPQVQRGVADVPLLQGLLGQFVSQLYAHLDPVRHVHGVGQVGGVVGAEVVVAVVAKQGTDTAALAFKGTHAERLVLADKGFAGSGVDEVAGNVGVADIGDAVESEERVEMYVVGNLALLGILLLHDVVGDVGPEVAVIPEYRLGHRGTQGRVHLAHQHRRLAERLGHPAGELRVLPAVFVVYPQAPGEGHAVVAAAEEGTVGRGSQRHLHLGLGLVEVLQVDMA